MGLLMWKCNGKGRVEVERVRGTLFPTLEAVKILVINMILRYPSPFVLQ